LINTYKCFYRGFLSYNAAVGIYIIALNFSGHVLRFCGLKPEQISSTSLKNLLVVTLATVVATPMENVFRNVVVSVDNAAKYDELIS